jgi:NitT/TauT family transport system ATP-binding protein
LIHIDHLNKEFTTKDSQKVVALQNVSLDIAQGEFIAIIGPSGCGKTTLLKMMAGLLQPDGGLIRIDGQAPHECSGNIGYMSQANSLLPWRTVSQNIQLGLEIRAVAAAERKKRARRMIRRLGLEGFENRYPFELSGGMRQRVSIMRALAYDPAILFMDEPFGALDVQTRDLLEDDILRIWAKTHKTIVFVTHDLSEATILADRVILMTSRPGTIKNIYRINLPRPRDTEFRLRPEFQAILREIWIDLSTEVKRTRHLQ